MSDSATKQKELEAKMFVPANEPGPQEGTASKVEMDPDEEGSTLLIRDFPEDEPMDDLESRLTDFATLRRPLTRVENGDIHVVYTAPKDVQSVLDWYSCLRAPRFNGHPVQLFALRGAPPKLVWED